MDAEQIAEKYGTPAYKPGERQAVPAPAMYEPSLTDRFDEQLANVVNTVRGDDYGHPADDFETVQRLKTALRASWKGDDPRLLHVLEMIAVKMSRLCNSQDHFDSWLDIAGYSRTALMVLDRTESEKD